MSFKSVNHKAQDIAIQDVVSRIKNGDLLQDIEDVTSIDTAERLKFSDSIILSPEYQRDYRSTIKDESALIESVLVGIPIPPVFLANDRYEGIKVLNVVDGQHRLRAFDRFLKNEFKLTGLTILKELEDKKFKDLSFETMEAITTYKLATTVFVDFPGLEYELEIFNRYNKGTKPLTQQDIRNAVYNSNLNKYVKDFSKKLLENEEYKLLKNAYNVTKDRYHKKKTHESIFVIMSILEKGLNNSYQNSSEYAENYMKEKAEVEKADYENSLLLTSEIISLFETFNKIIVDFTKKIEFPFSREIYGVSNRNFKFQISIAMIISAIFNKMIKEGIKLEIFFGEEEQIFILNFFKETLENSYLEDLGYNASSTSPTQMKKLIDSVDVEKFKNCP